MTDANIHARLIELFPKVLESVEDRGARSALTIVVRGDMAAEVVALQEAFNRVENSATRNFIVRMVQYLGGSLTMEEVLKRARSGQQ